MKKLTPLIIMMGVGLMLTACQAKDGIPAKYQPKLNPHPKYFMAVKGKIDPALKNKVQLVWRATYYATNPSCEYITNTFEGASRPYSKEIWYSVKNHSFGLSIPLDRYQPGKCKWQILGVSYQYYYNNYLYSNLRTGVSFNQNKPLTHTSIVQHWQCIENGCELLYDGLAHLTSYGSLYPEQSYTYNLVIK